MNVVMDFPADLSKGIKRISEAIKGLDVGLLVNNIGVLYSYAVMPWFWWTNGLLPFSGKLISLFSFFPN